MNAETDSLLDPELLQQYAIVDREADFEDAVQNGSRKVAPGSVISVKSHKSSKNKVDKPKNQINLDKNTKKRNNRDQGSKSSKKIKS